VKAAGASRSSVSIRAMASVGLTGMAHELSLGAFQRAQQPPLPNELSASMCCSANGHAAAVYTQPTGRGEKVRYREDFYVRASACSLIPSARMTLRIVSMPGLRSPDRAL